MTPEQFFAKARHEPAPVTPCVKTADQWCVHKTGISPMAVGGMDVATNAEEVDLLKQMPLPRLIGRCMKAAGFAMTRNPQVGDVGAVVIGGKIVCAVKGKRMWVFRSDEGMGAISLDSRLVGAWRVE